MTTWVVKISKYCNLRCAYCYEWDELGDARRMSIPLWERVIDAAKQYRDRTVRHLGSGATQIVVHGGEPLAVPLPYLRQLLDAYRCAVGSSSDFRLALQTNLYRLTDDHIALVKEYGVSLGVSFDLVGGVRRSLAGKETEAAVIRNMDRLRAAGIPFGAITVLASHTAPRLTDVYDFFAARQISLRVLPLSEGSSERPEALFSLANDEILRSMQRLFVHWIETGRAINVTPFDGYLGVAVRKALGVRAPLWSRRHDGEAVIIANTDGRLYRMDDLYEESALLGDLSSDSIGEILSSERYARTLAFDEALLARVCGGCSFEGACDGTPASASKHGALHQGRCAIASPMSAFVAEYLSDLRFTREELMDLVLEDEASRAA